MATIQEVLRMNKEKYFYAKVPENIMNLEIDRKLDDEVALYIAKYYVNLYSTKTIERRESIYFSQNELFFAATRQLPNITEQNFSVLNHIAKLTPSMTKLNEALEQNS